MHWVASVDPRPPGRRVFASRGTDCAATVVANADNSSQQEIIGRGHQRNRRRDPGTAVQARGRPTVCVARRATAAGRSPGCGVVVLPHGGLILGKCKAIARGLNQDELDKHWAAADLVGARATFAVTLDRAASCGAEWMIRVSPNRRPHFALTAVHLFDLDDAGPIAGEDLFDWRDDYPPGPGPEPQDREALLHTAFNEYIEPTGKDYEQRYRAVDDARSMSS